MGKFIGRPPKFHRFHKLRPTNMKNDILHHKYEEYLLSTKEKKLEVSSPI